MALKGAIKKNAKPATKKKRAYDASPARKDARVKRNKARRDAVKSGAAKKGDGKDVGHIKGLAEGGSNAKSNRRMESAKANRSAGGKVGGKRSSGGGRPKKGTK
jgi:hypothetical protein